MEFQYFFSLLAQSIGLFGAFLLSISIIKLSPIGMLRQTPGFSKIGYSPEQISPMAAQKAQAIMGIFFIFLAYIVQVVLLIFIQHKLKFCCSQWMNYWTFSAIIFIMIVISIFAIKGMKNFFIAKANKEAEKQRKPDHL